MNRRIHAIAALIVWIGVFVLIGCLLAACDDQPRRVQCITYSSGPDSAHVASCYL